MTPITIGAVADILEQYTPIYRNRPPVYQTVMLADLATIWQRHHPNLLDIGGGTGVMAEAMQALLPVDSVTAIDVVDRYFPNLTVETRVFDGSILPFDDANFAAAAINNVIHHVDLGYRIALMREVRRVVVGPVYIKDHVARSSLDHMRLMTLDAIGNIPFGGQVRARYLSLGDWSELARESGYRITATSSGEYRTGMMARVFPNRLEAAFRLDPA